MSASAQPAWSFQQGIKYECARDVITDCMGILTAEIYSEPDPIKRQALKDLRRAFAEQRVLFHVNEDEKISGVLAKYTSFFIERITRDFTHGES